MICLVEAVVDIWGIWTIYVKKKLFCMYGNHIFPVKRMPNFCPKNEIGTSHQKKKKKNLKFSGKAHNKKMFFKIF